MKCAEGGIDRIIFVRAVLLSPTRGGRKQASKIGSSHDSAGVDWFGHFLASDTYHIRTSHENLNLRVIDQDSTNTVVHQSIVIIFFLQRVAQISMSASVGIAFSGGGISAAVGAACAWNAIADIYPSSNSINLTISTVSGGR